MKNHVILLFTLLALSLTSAYAEAASPESVKNLLNKTDSGQMGIQAMKQMLPALKKMVPDAPEKFWQDFMAEVSPNDLVDMVIPIYQKHLTQNEVKAINAFYDTPAGKKLIRVQPYIVQESMAAGQAWGQNIAQKVINTFKQQNQ